jgi:hypothetical protein
MSIIFRLQSHTLHILSSSLTTCWLKRLWVYLPRPLRPGLRLRLATRTLSYPLAIELGCFECRLGLFTPSDSAFGYYACTLSLPPFTLVSTFFTAWTLKASACIRWTLKSCSLENELVGTRFGAVTSLTLIGHHAAQYFYVVTICSRDTLASF